MSSDNRTRYEVQKILSDAVKNALVAYIGADHGFSVMEFAQASFVKSDKIVLINLVRTNRVGWQMAKYPVKNDELLRKDEWIEEQSWQFHTIIKKGANPAITDLQADDVGQMLISYFGGVGVAFLRSNGVAPLRIASENLVVYNDDSELYQKRAVFTLKLQVPKSLSQTQVDLEALVPDIKPV